MKLAYINIKTSNRTLSKFETADLLCNKNYVVVIYYGIKGDISMQCTATVIIN